MVCGGSKRGWTTWTTAAVDKRVVAIVPFVIDMLNIEPSFVHHWEAYGFWAPAVGDYVQMKLMDWNGTPEYRALMKIEEPFEYRSRLTMPKFIVNATGDQFFLPDSSQFYFNDLVGPKYLRYVPNADHSLKGTDAPFTLLAYYGAVLNDTQAARVLAGRSTTDDSMHVKTDDEAERSQAVVRHESRGPRFPRGEDRQGLEERAAFGPGRRHLRRQGGQAGEGLHGLHGRADLPQRHGRRR